jgi:hypothetical protein
MTTMHHDSRCVSSTPLRGCAPAVGRSTAGVSLATWPCHGAPPRARAHPPPRLLLPPTAGWSMRACVAPTSRRWGRCFVGDGCPCRFEAETARASSLALSCFLRLRSSRPLASAHRQCWTAAALRRALCRGCTRCRRRPGARSPTTPCRFVLLRHCSAHALARALNLLFGRARGAGGRGARTRGICSRAAVVNRGQRGEWFFLVGPNKLTRAVSRSRVQRKHPCPRLCKAPRAEAGEARHVRP